MDKPFDLKNLVDRLKSQGLDVAEDAAKIVAKETLAWVKESVLATTNPFDDLALGVLPVVSDFIMSEIDKIDGKPN